MTATFADLRQRHVWPSEWESTSNNTEKFSGILYPLGYETVVFANTLKASHLIGEKSIFLSNGKKLSSNIMLHAQAASITSLKLRGKMIVSPPMWARKFPIVNRIIVDYKRFILKNVCCIFGVSGCLYGSCAVICRRELLIYLHLGTKLVQETYCPKISECSQWPKQVFRACIIDMDH